MVQHVYSSFKNDDGSWREHFIDNPQGGHIRLYLNLDRTERKGAEERIGRNITKLLKEPPLNRTAEFHRKSNEIVVD